MKRFLILANGLGIVAALAAGFATAGTAQSSHSLQILIKHQTRGCHAWSVNGSAFGASRTGRAEIGGLATFVNNDIMPHKLILTSGPTVKFVGKPAMNRMGATVKVVFTKAGTYRFTTKPGEDYKGMAQKTTGEDNVLHLTVKVS